MADAIWREHMALGMAAELTLSALAAILVGCREETMHDGFGTLSVVALLDDVPEEGLVRGQVGTVVEDLGSDHYEIEFSDDGGRTYAQLPLHRDKLLRLHHRRVEAP